MNAKTYLVVNFGGPRNLSEIEPFLRALLCDPEVIRPHLPLFFHNRFFSRVAKKRALKIRADYALIGGGSPIYFDTEWIANTLSLKLSSSVLTFHRYLPKTHKEILEKLEAHPAQEIVVFPLFPQFTYATTGSIARFFSEKLSRKTQNKLRWVKSYPAHAAFISFTQNNLRAFFQQNQLQEEETFLLFSAHGLPQDFVEKGDIYAHECALSFDAIKTAFPKARAKLCYQSKFGPGKWLRPYTQELCKHYDRMSEKRPNIVFVPISFTSDHIETLFEIEKLYMPILTQKGFRPYRLPAPGRNPDWLDAILQILQDSDYVSNDMLVRRT